MGGNAALGILPNWSISGFVNTIWNSSADLLDPLAVSAILGAIAASICTVLAWSLAWACRASRIWRVIAVISVAITLAAPGPVVGSALVLAYRSLPIVYDTPAVLVAAYVTRAFPYVFVVLWPGVRGLPKRYFESAAVDGFGPIRQALLIGMPLTLRSISAAWSVGLLVSLGELPASNLVEVPRYTTLARRSLGANAHWS